MAPEILTPGKDGNGNYFGLTIRNREGVLITGKYNLLDLSGACLYHGPLNADEGSEAGRVILSGANIPKGCDLTKLLAEEFFAQGIRASYLELCNVTDHVDVSHSKINLLDLSAIDYNIELCLRGGKFDVIDFGQNVHNKLDFLDLRDTETIRTEGAIYADIKELLLNEGTKVPKYLIMEKFDLIKNV